jgi:hypothetical protein
MSLRWVIPGELLSSIARFRFTHRSHPKPETSRSSAENQRTATVSKLRCLTLGVQSTEFLRCSKAHVQNLLAGKVKESPPLPYIPLGRRKLIRRESLLRWIEKAEGLHE